MLMAAAAVATGEETLPIFFKQRETMSGKSKEKKTPRD